MALGFTETVADDMVTGQGIMGSLRCANPNCNNVVAQAHLIGMGILRVLSCPSCGRGSEYENTPRGWTVRMLPKRATQQSQQQQQGQQRK
jgi:hypothetical protein